MTKTIIAYSGFLARPRHASTWCQLPRVYCFIRTADRTAETTSAARCACGPSKRTVQHLGAQRLPVQYAKLRNAAVCLRSPRRNSHTPRRGGSPCCQRVVLPMHRRSRRCCGVSAAMQAGHTQPLSPLHDGGNITLASNTPIFFLEGDVVVKVFSPMALRRRLTASPIVTRAGLFTLLTCCLLVVDWK